MAGVLKKKPGLNGRSFKSLFSAQRKKYHTVKIEVKSPENNCVAKETLAKTETMLGDDSREEKVQTSKIQVSDLIRESRDADIDGKCRDHATLSKIKRDSCMDPHALSGCETSDDYKTCVTCFKRQRLCDGKYSKTSCHSSSVNPYTDDVPVGVWHCFQCLNNKMQAGACPLSENVEGIWNATRESEISDAEGLQKEKQYFGKSSPSKFVEFWVPSILSNVQLEQYCETLLSNSISLCSCSKMDPVGALRDIVFSTRKSCDHPYIVDPSLNRLVTKDLPPTSFLDAGIKASGKLKLLEMILLEIKKRQLRVLILFQSVAGSGKDTLGLGDLLDDFLSERFGVDTFERVDRGVNSSKSRQTALCNFNTGNGRFMFLLENRACLPSIKLVSVDTIIIFDSDWNPANDVKALNKISIDSQFKQIMIFRLYSAFTVEEKVLILAKQRQTLDSNLNSISRASNTLLMWGASYLFDRLDEFHSTPDMNVSSEHALSIKVVDEISALLSQNGECDGIENSCILKIQQRGGNYNSYLKLFGEQQDQLADDEHPHNFWTNLLNRRILKWKFVSRQTHERHRKKVQYFDDTPKNAECGAVVGKKRKNGETNCTNPNPGFEQDMTGGATNLLHPNTVPTSVSEKSMLHDAQTNIDLVKPDLLKLCEILEFSDEVKIMAERILKYVISTNQVKSGSASTLQAFLIALSWGSASLLKQKVNRKDSLSLARKHLNFCCSEIEADSLYSSAVLKLMKTFKENMLPDLSDNSMSGVQNIKEETLNEDMSQLQTVKPELEEIRDKVHTDKISQDDERHEADTENNFELIQRKCKKRIEKLKQKQEEEIKEKNNIWEAKRKEIESKHRVDSICYTEVYKEPLLTDQMKVLDNKYKMNLEGLECQKELSLEELKAKHLDALSNERSKVEQWLKSESIATKVAGQDELALQQSGIQNEVGYSQASQHVSPIVSENDTTLSRYPDDFASETNIDKMLPDSACATDPNQDVRCIGHDVITENTNRKNDEVASESVPVARSQQPNGLGSPANGVLNISENDSALSRHDNDFTSDANMVKMVPGDICVNDPNQDVRCNSLEGIINITENMNCKDSELENMAVARSQQPNELGSATNGLENCVFISLHHSENQNPDKVLSSEPGVVILPETPESVQEQVTDRIVEENPLGGDRERHLAENQPEIRKQLVECAEELRSQVQHLGSNVELHPPTGVIETPIQPNQPDLLSTSTLDHQPLFLNTSLLNSEAVPQVIGNTTELPRQLVIPTGVDMYAVQGFQDQVPSQVLKLTSYSDPLQKELERFHKETEQAIKHYEDVKMRLKFEFEELVAQLRKKYEDNCKDLDVVFQQKKNELDKNYSKVLMNEILADAFRCKCAEPSGYNGVQQGVPHGLVQPQNQLPSSAACRSSAITVTSSGGKPAGCQQNTALIWQPLSRVHPHNVTPTACQPAASQQNTVLLSQYGTQLLPVASSSGSQPAGKQQRTTLLMQPEPGSNIVSDSSSAGRPAASQQYITPLLHPSPRITPIVISSSVQAASTQQNTPPLQIVQQSAALFSNTPTRPLQINPITPTMGNLRVGSENRARAPAPHLQALGSASTRDTPSQLTRSSLPLSSHSLPHCPSPSEPPN